MTPEKLEELAVYKLTGDFKGMKAVYTGFSYEAVDDDFSIPIFYFHTKYRSFGFTEEYLIYVENL